MLTFQKGAESVAVPVPDQRHEDEDVNEGLDDVPNVAIVEQLLDLVPVKVFVEPNLRERFKKTEDLQLTIC